MGDDYENEKLFINADSVLVGISNINKRLGLVA